MDGDSLLQPCILAAQARQLGLALDAIEAQLDTLEQGAGVDLIAQALADQIPLLGAAAKEVG